MKTKVLLFLSIPVLFFSASASPSERSSQDNLDPKIQDLNELINFLVIKIEEDDKFVFDIRNLNLKKENGEISDDHFLTTLILIVPSKLDDLQASTTSFLAPKGYDINDFTQIELQEVMTTHYGFLKSDMSTSQPSTRMVCTNKTENYVSEKISIVASALNSKLISGEVSVDMGVMITAILLKFTDDFYNNCIEEVYGEGKIPNIHNPSMYDPAMYEGDAYLKKVNEDYGGFYKGDDVKIYYRDWYQKVIDHPLFKKYIEAMRFFSTASLINVGSPLQKFDRTSFCKSEMFDPLDPEPESDMNYVIKVNNCVVQNITKVFRSEISEFKELAKNEEASYDFYYYMLSYYVHGDNSK